MERDTNNDITEYEDFVLHYKRFTRTEALQLACDSFHEARCGVKEMHEACKEYPCDSFCRFKEILTNNIGTL